MFETDHSDADVTILLVTESSRVLERRFRMFETDRSDADVTILLVTESSRVLERRFRMFETDRSDADVTIPAGDRKQQSSRTPI